MNEIIYKIEKIVREAAEIILSADESKMDVENKAGIGNFVKEAGGKVTDMNGGKVRFDRPCSILASNNREDYLKYVDK